MDGITRDAEIFVSETDGINPFSSAHYALQCLAAGHDAAGQDFLDGASLKVDMMGARAPALLSFRRKWRCC